MDGKARRRGVSIQTFVSRRVIKLDASRSLPSRRLVYNILMETLVFL